MKQRIALGAGLLLTLGSAVGGTYMYGQGHAEEVAASVLVRAEQEAPTPYTIAMWTATASSTDYVVPKVPL